ncbi:MAG TPA: SpoIIE family protein phosphatase [Polyangiaceae bacterium]|nr:SpoIIE family protein phosphatase [Polyangiaceae bacterium]
MVVRGFGASRALFALIDVLGHGPAAAEAAAIAVAALHACDASTDAPGAVARLGAALRGGRGAAALVGVIDGQDVEACIVGNVELRASRSGAVGVVHSPGVLGVSIRKLHVFGGQVQPGDRLVAYSDGIAGTLGPADLEGLAPEAACEWALDRFGSPDDDASVLVLDVLR